MTFGYSIEKYLFAAWLLMVSTILYSQDATLSGIISDNNGMPVQAATVAISGTTLGSATDQNGYYHTLDLHSDKLIDNNAQRKLFVTIL